MRFDHAECQSSENCYQHSMLQLELGGLFTSQQNLPQDWKTRFRFHWAGTQHTTQAGSEEEFTNERSGECKRKWFSFTK